MWTDFFFCMPVSRSDGHATPQQSLRMSQSKATGWPVNVCTCEGCLVFSWNVALYRHVSVSFLFLYIQSCSIFWFHSSPRCVSQQRTQSTSNSLCSAQTEVSPLCRTPKGNNCIDGVLDTSQRLYIPIKTLFTLTRWPYRPLPALKHSFWRHVSIFGDENFKL
jgi:hypothetical protein